MFIPQRPYFPNGALRDALAYPERPESYTDTQLAQALERALLPALANDLDRSDAWGQKLSGGEQQRLALARVFLKQPQWVFADEATSALDTTTEATLYQRLVEMVATRGGALVSIAHRPGVASFHTKAWVLTEQTAVGDARFTVEEKRL
jgi:putative ATP-binding cassette transporter